MGPCTAWLTSVATRVSEGKGGGAFLCNRWRVVSRERPPLAAAMMSTKEGQEAVVRTGMIRT